MSASAIAEGKTVFRSKDPNYRLVRVPQRRRYNERGELEILPGEAYQFGREGLVIDDPDAIRWLRNHRSFNVKFTEVGNEPDAVHPTLEEQMAAISEAAVNRSIEDLVLLYDEERGTHNRTPVLAAADAAMKQIESSNAEGESAPESISPPEEGVEEE